MRENHRLFLALDSSDRMGSGLQPALAALEGVGETIADAYGLTYDAKVTVRGTFAMVVALALFEEQLFAGTAAIGQERIKRAIGDMFVAITFYVETGESSAAAPRRG